MKNLKKSRDTKSDHSFEYTILIVEDDHMISEVISDTIVEYLFEQHYSEQHYTVKATYDGESAWKLLQVFTYDLILLDVMLPKMDGITLCRKLRSQGRDIPILMLTAREGLENEMEALDAGANLYMTKPFEIQELLHNIKIYIDKNNALERANNRINKLLEINRELIKANFNLKSKQNFKSTNKDINFYQVISGAVAHNLKNEFLQISTFAKSLIELTDGSSEILEECQIIIRSIEYSKMLLQRFLNYLDLGNMPTEPVNILDLLEKIKLLIIPRLPSNINLEIKTNFDIKSQVKANSNFEQLQLVLMELIKNSINAMRTKGGKITILVKRLDKIISINVIDNASGIPTNIIHNLFEQKVSSKTGSGLGLFLSKKIIEELDGNLILRSTSEIGTEMEILIPEFKT